MDWPHGETVTLLTPGTTTDAYGQTVADWATPTALVFTLVPVWPRTTAETAEPGRVPVVVGLTVVLPAGTAVTTLDRVTVRGATYDVDGIPFDWLNPFTGWAPGVTVDLKRREG